MHDIIRDAVADSKRCRRAVPRRWRGRGDAAIVVTMLPNSAVVENVVTGAGGVFASAKPGSPIMDMSTVTRKQPMGGATGAGAWTGIRRCAGGAPARRMPTAANGCSWWRVGEDFARVRPARGDGQSDPSLRAAGAGTRTKLVNNYPRGVVVPDERRGAGAFAALRARSRKDAGGAVRHDGDQRATQDRVAGESAEGRYVAGLHHRPSAQGPEPDRRRRQCREGADADGGGGARGLQLGARQASAGRIFPRWSMPCARLWSARPELEPSTSSTQAPRCPQQQHARSSATWSRPAT